jgi:hypothetical protein
MMAFYAPLFEPVAQAVSIIDLSASRRRTGAARSSNGIAMEMSANTVRTYCKTILNKVGVRRQTELCG